MDELTRGVLYIVFGDNARRACLDSLASLRKLHPDLPVMVIGDEYGQDIPGTEYIRWTLKTPYDNTKQSHFQFRAGLVKPFLYDLSPYDKTLYIDADTEFQGDITPGFELLDHYDMMYAKHSSHNVGMLTMMPGSERQATIAELGTGDVPYPNSGVIFWRHCYEAGQVFQSWYTEWMRFREWDEQLALMRAVYKNPCRLLLLPESWNGENRKEGSIIFHDFHGQQRARSDAPLAATFQKIHDEHLWPSQVSISGSGSDISNTEHVRLMLPAILRGLGIGSILDAGCGDWNWMQTVDLSGIEYSGCDIVPALVEANSAKWPEHRFFVADLTRDELPKADVILCRSVLFHLSFDNVKKVLANFRETGAKWLLTTTFPYLAENADIADGKWHRLNLQAKPFDYPVPWLLVPEGIEVDGWLSLWRIEDIITK